MIRVQFGQEHTSPSGTAYIIPAYWQSLWNSLAQVATALGSFMVAEISDRFGRRTAFFASGLVSIVGVAVLYISSSAGVFLAGKMVNGIALGMSIACGQTYISEISPVKSRGILLSVYILSLVCLEHFQPPMPESASNTLQYFGAFIGNLISNSRVNIPDQSSYKVMFALGFVWAGMLVGGAWLIPESPIHYIRKGCSEKAQASFKRLYNKSTNITLLFEEASATDRQEKEASGGAENSRYVDCPLPQQP